MLKEQWKKEKAAGVVSITALYYYYKENLDKIKPPTSNKEVSASEFEEAIIKFLMLIETHAGFQDFRNNIIMLPNGKSYRIDKEIITKKVREYFDEKFK